MSLSDDVEVIRHGSLALFYALGGEEEVLILMNIDGRNIDSGEEKMTN